MFKPLDPRICNVSIDNNALDKGHGTTRDVLIDRLLHLHEIELVNLVVPNGVRSEALDSKTPLQVRQIFSPLIYTESVGHNADETKRLDKLSTLIRGNAGAGKHEADIQHLFEAGKYSGYFITNDTRLLKKYEEIRRIAGTQLMVLTLEEFFEIYDKYEEEFPSERNCSDFSD